MVIGGGIIPEEDIGKLKTMGIREIFPPGNLLGNNFGLDSPQCAASLGES
jgi:methylmalonyl-CoA mutase cobalamin-binding domain/chain